MSVRELEVEKVLRGMLHYILKPSWKTKTASEGSSVLWIKPITFSRLCIVICAFGACTATCFCGFTLYCVGYMHTTVYIREILSPCVIEENFNWQYSPVSTVLDI